MSNENLKIWVQVEETDPDFTKKVSYGNRSFTTVSAQYQIKQATEIFGLYGEKWGIESIDYDFKDVTGGQILVLGRAVFFYHLDREKITFPISGSIFMQEYNNTKKVVMVDDEFAKKIETDITTKALSKLGFAADIFLGRYDDNKYVNDLKKKYADIKPPPPDKKKTPAPTQNRATNTPPPTRGAETPNKEKKPLTMATQNDINSLITLVKKRQFQRAQKGIKYWEADGRGIMDDQKKKIMDLIKAMRK